MEELNTTLQFSNTELLLGALALLFAGLLSFALTPLAREIGFKIGAVDVPDKVRHFHKEPTPRCGGLSIFLAFFAGVLIFAPLTNETIGLLLGTLAVLLLGLADDKYRLKPWVKFLGQIAVSLIPIAFGMRIEHISLLHREIEFGVFSIPVTMLWIIGMTNAVNLIDGLDGLACGVSAISSVALLICAIVSAQVSGVPLLIAILAGACIGFLPFNVSPAKIFMGDSGALSLGFVLSLLSMQGFFKVNAFFSLLLVFAFPLGDTVVSFFRRIFHKGSPFQADRKHLHYKLVDLGFSQRGAVSFLLTFSGIFGVSAVLFSMRRYLESGISAATALIVLFAVYFAFRAKSKHVSEPVAKQEDKQGEDQR